MDERRTTSSRGAAAGGGDRQDRESSAGVGQKSHVPRALLGRGAAQRKNLSRALADFRCSAKSALFRCCCCSDICARYLSSIGASERA